MKKIVQQKITNQSNVLKILFNNEELDQYIEKVDFEEHFLDSSKVFDYIITVWNKKEYVKVRISDSHMHVVCIEKNGKIYFKLL